MSAKPASAVRARGARFGFWSARLDRLPQADAARLGPGAQLLHRLLADPARRHVDDPLQRHAVGGVARQPHVGQRVLDLAALVEAGAADELVRDAEAHERLFQHPALGVDPIADGDLAVAQRAVLVIGATR